MWHISYLCPPLITDADTSTAIICKKSEHPYLQRTHTDPERIRYISIHLHPYVQIPCHKLSISPFHVYLCLSYS